MLERGRGSEGADWMRWAGLDWIYLYGIRMEVSCCTTTTVACRGAGRDIRKLGLRHGRAGARRWRRGFWLRRIMGTAIIETQPGSARLRGIGVW